MLGIYMNLRGSLWVEGLLELYAELGSDALELVDVLIVLALVLNLGLDAYKVVISERSNTAGSCMLWWIRGL